MAHKKKNRRPAPRLGGSSGSKPQALPAKTATSFITLRSRSSRFLAVLQILGIVTDNQQHDEARAELNKQAAKKAGFIDLTPAAPPKSEPEDRASSPHIAPIHTNTSIPQEPPDMKTRGAWDKNLSNANRPNVVIVKDEPSSPSNKPTKRGPIIRKRASSIRGPSNLFVDELPSSGVKRRRIQKKTVTFAAPAEPTLLDTLSEGLPSASSPESDERSDKENSAAPSEDMEAPARPKLKLNFSGTHQPPTSAPSSSPPAATPTLKFKVGSKDKDGSAKKRKREPDDVGRSLATPLSAGGTKIKFKKPSVAQTPITPAINLKAKGKVQKRPLGVGYDSELSDSERDPVILEGIMLRMQPGPDCDYIRDAINKGTMGISKSQGGAEVSVRALDDKGRRCVVRVRQNQYAATLVDLPCLIEGMKSWDNKRFIKSIDVCQMMIVLGRVDNDDEAKAFPLPEGVDPKTYAYAHGITAPMHWVRKRRFDRTRRKPTHQIEAIDRRVNQLLSADATAISTTYSILDHDPRSEDDEQYSESDETDDDEDAEGEEDDYFSHERHVADEEVDEFNAIFGGAGEEDEDDDTPMADSFHAAANTNVDSSGFATSNADDSPDVTNSAAPTTAPTPAGEVSTPAGPSEGGDSDDNDDDDGDHEEQNEQDEKNAAVKERIGTLQTKIDEQKRQLEKTATSIIRRKIAQSIQKLETEISMLNRELNGGKEQGDDEDDEDDDEVENGG